MGITATETNHLFNIWDFISHWKKKCHSEHNFFYIIMYTFLFILILTELCLILILYSNLIYSTETIVEKFYEENIYSDICLDSNGMNWKVRTILQSWLCCQIIVLLHGTTLPRKTTSCSRGLRYFSSFDKMLVQLKLHFIKTRKIAHDNPHLPTEVRSRSLLSAA